MNPALQLLPAAREYTLRVLQFPKKAVTRVARASKPRHSSATITWLYRQFVEGHLPRYATSEQFIATSIPFLLRAMSPEAVTILAAVFARRHADLWHRQRASHMAACSTQIRNLLPGISGSLPGRIPELLQTLQVRNREHATTTAIICSSLADEKGRFFLDCRSLQRRLLLSQPRSALRILQRLERLQIITRVEAGSTLWDAKAAGIKPRANAYVLRSDTQ